MCIWVCVYQAWEIGVAHDSWLMNLDAAHLVLFQSLTIRGDSGGYALCWMILLYRYCNVKRCAVPWSKFFVIYHLHQYIRIWDRRFCCLPKHWAAQLLRVANSNKVVNLYCVDKPWAWYERPIIFCLSWVRLVMTYWQWPDMAFSRSINTIG